MKRSDPEIRSLLAAEYVLGTLTGGARRRFEQQMLQSRALRDEVLRWEQHLAATLQEGVVTEASPPASVWEAISRRIGIEDAAAPAVPAQAPSAGRPRRHRKRIGLALAASVVLALVVMLLPTRVDQPPSGDGLAKAPDAQALQPAARIALDDATHRAEWMLGTIDAEVYVRAVSMTPLPDTQDYELWWLAGDDSAPVSLGVLPKTGMRPLQIPPGAEGLDRGALAVSLESAGGSSDGNPGEVLAAFPLADTQ